MLLCGGFSVEVFVFTLKLRKVNCIAVAVVYDNCCNSMMLDWSLLQLNGLNQGCFDVYMSQNVATSMPSLTGQSCGGFLPVVCLARKGRAIYKDYTSTY